MEFNYTVFNPENSKKARAILNTPPQTLVNRYIKKKEVHTLNFFGLVQEEVNKVDGEGYLLNPNLYDIEGKNLDFIANQLHIQASKLRQLGYELRLNNVLTDLDRMFNDHLDEVTHIEKQTEIRPVTKEISHFFSDILSNTVINELEKIQSQKLQ